MKRALVAISFLIASCGGAEGPYEAVVPGTDEPKSDIDGYEARIAELRGELDQTLPAGGADPLAEPRGDLPVDPSDKCLVAADLRDRICDLSERICAIAASGSGAADDQHKCASSTAACEDARARVRSACGEL